MSDQRYRKTATVLAHQTIGFGVIRTLEGTMRYEVGDYILTGSTGERRPVRRDIFESTYELDDDKPATIRFTAADCVACDDCGQPMVPNLSTEDDDGFAWYCINPGCLVAAETMMEAEGEDLVAIGIPRPWAEIIAAALTELGDRLADDEHGTTDDDKPEPCPHCGGEVIELEFSAQHNGFDYDYRCTACGLLVAFEDDADDADQDADDD